jgi:hypothetical protein
LENDRIRVVISAVDHALGSAASGGWIIDAATRGGSDSFGQASLVLRDADGIREPRHTQAEILPPAGDGGAGVRFIGEDTRVEEIRVETEYTLGSSDPFVRVRTTYFWVPREEGGELAAFDLVRYGRANPFLPFRGFLAEGEEPDADSTSSGGALLLMGEESSYAWRSDACRAISAPSRGAIRFHLRPERSGERRLVFERRLDVVEGAEAVLPGGAPGDAYQGRVEALGSGRPVGGAVVEFRDASGLVSAALTRPDGSFRADLPAGDYTAAALFPGGREGPRKEFRAGGSRGETLLLRTEEPASIRFRVEGENGAPIPARLTIRDGSGNRILRQRGRLPLVEFAFAGDGIGTLTLPPGDYRLTASAGIESSIDERRADLRAGETEELSFRIRREVDTEGLLAVDLRVQTIGGLEGPSTLEEQMEATAADGLDAIVVADNGSIPSAIPEDRAGAVRVLPGEEIWLAEVGRFGVFPLAPGEEIPPRGGEGAEGKGPASLFRLARSRGSSPLIQVHAPRHPGTGYFAAMNLDPVTGLSTNLEFDASFDLLEVADALEIKEASAVLSDWFHLLNIGHRVLATGNSGSAGRAAQPPGVPRNYVEAGASGGDLSGIIDSIRNGRIFLTTGPILRFRALGDRSASGLVQDSGGLVAVELRVDAAEWIDVDRVRIFANGSPLIDRKVSREEGTRVLDLRESLAINGDAWLVAVASGSRPLDPVYRAPDGEPIFPVAVTSPIWVDFDGDGAFDPPGVP